MDNKSSEPDVGINARGNISIDKSFNTTNKTTINIAASRTTDDISDALKNNRSFLKDLKVQYANLVVKDGGIERKASNKRIMIFEEILRTWGAMEALKNELIRRGVRFDLDEHDNEHPNAAYARIMKVRQPDGAVFWYLVFAVIVFFLWFFTSIRSQ
jgi:hypothetical protein